MTKPSSFRIGRRGRGSWRWRCCLWRGRLVQKLREKQYAGRTVDTYGQWVEMFQQCCAAKGMGLEAVSGVVDG